MSLAILTFVHVVLSLVGIGSGLVALYGMLTARRLNGWTAVFLTTTVATNVTGFLFPFREFLPSHAVGILSLIVLSVTLPARYLFRMQAAWGRIYVVTAVLSLYLNVFVLFAQLFQKVPFLKALAPTQSEAPFLVTQLVLLVTFVVLTIAAAAKFRPQAQVLNGAPEPVRSRSASNARA